MFTAKEKKCKSCDELSDFVSQVLVLDEWREKLIKISNAAKEIGKDEAIEQKAYKTLKDIN